MRFLTPIVLLAAVLTGCATDVQPLLEASALRRQIFDDQTAAFRELVRQGEQSGMPAATAQAWRTGIETNATQYAKIQAEHDAFASELGEVDWRELYDELRRLYEEFRK